MRLFASTLALSLALISAGCSTTDVDEGPLPDPPPTDASLLPLLEGDFTVGTTLYGSADLSALDARGSVVLGTAIAQGLTGFTYYVDWFDLEPEPGRYTLDEFTETLRALQERGVQTFVNLTVGDIEEYNLPEDLSDGQAGLGDGVSLDDPALIERFGQILDRIVPIALEHDVFFLGVGNEIDARFDGEFPDELEPYVRFTEAARERVHAIEPQLAVGVALTTNAIRNRTRTFRELRAVSDIIPFNYGPIQPDFFVEDSSDVRADFEEVLAGYGSEGPIMIQELTCPSATSMRASEEWQRDCFERLFEVLEERPQVRFASIFTYQDFDETTCNIVRDFFFGGELDDLPQEFAQRLADYTCELGVVRADGTPKPAWQVILDEL